LLWFFLISGVYDLFEQRSRGVKMALYLCGKYKIITIREI